MGKLQKNKKMFTRNLLKVKKNKISTKKMKNKIQIKDEKERYGEMSLDDFLNKDFDEISTDSEAENDMDNSTILQKIVENNKTMTNMKNADSVLDQSDSDDEVVCHKESLVKLKDTDPEFYKFLQENDKKLLDFNLSDSDDKDTEENYSSDEIHEPLGDLEVASDESDFEDETKNTDNTVITLKMLKTWQKDIQTDKSNGTIVKLIQAFHAAIVRVSNNIEEGSAYKVEGSSIFNGVIQVCVLELEPAVRRYLRIPAGSKQPPHKSKKFVKIKAILRGYFVDLLKLLNGVTSPNILSVLLKHLHYLSPILVSYSTVLKHLLKKLISLWGTADETVRVIAFLCIVRLINNQQQNNLDMILKSMYMTYVQNSKFVSPNTLPMINFMRRSLVEIYSLDLSVSYQHVFLYIRQLAIHLRNAVTVKKKENMQAVYNWQFINSLKLWGNLLAVNNNKHQLQPLIYPFVQVCLGTINLIPTVQYYPLRFHVTEILIEFSSLTLTFIPILPFLLEVLTSYDFNRRHQKVSMKPMNFLFTLRLSKSQLIENAFKDAVIDVLYDQILQYLAYHSNSVGFPDLSLLCIVQIKTFLKKCSVAAYCRKMRQILEKIEQNNKFIWSERKQSSFNLIDSKQIEAWETTVKNKGPPLLIYYESWKTIKTVKKRKEATNNEEIGDYDLPVLKKNKKYDNTKRDVSQKSTDQVELFPSDTESENEMEVKLKNKIPRGKRGGKNVNKKTAPVVLDEDIEDDNCIDFVEDLKESDW